jgi:hypothetical protein
MDKGNAAAENYDTMIISIWLSHEKPLQLAANRRKEGTT